MTSGRGTDAPYADSLNTTGMYSITRNPIYFGNFFTFLSPVLFVRNFWLIILYIAIFALYHERIIFAEECFLQRKFGSDYKEWGTHTPIFFPCFTLWRKPARLFSWKMAVRRECISFFTLVATIWSLKLFEHYLDYQNIVFDRVWLVMFAVSGTVYLIVAAIVQFTRFFDR
jgi:steroid 5-alpha reductase family enzyme